MSEVDDVSLSACCMSFELLPLQNSLSQLGSLALSLRYLEVFSCWEKVIEY